MTTDEYPSIVSGVDVEIAWDADTTEMLPALDERWLASSPARGVRGEAWSRARGWLSED